MYERVNVCAHASVYRAILGRDMGMQGFWWWWFACLKLYVREGYGPR